MLALDELHWTTQYEDYGKSVELGPCARRLCVPEFLHLPPFVGLVGMTFPEPDHWEARNISDPSRRIVLAFLGFSELIRTVHFRGVNDAIVTFAVDEAEFVRDLEGIKVSIHRAINDGEFYRWITRDIMHAAQRLGAPVRCLAS